jgi:hypothetical protein
MKVLFFALVLGLFNACSTVAQISCDMFINGKAASTLSKSETNIITLKGTGFDSFELKTQGGIELKETDEGYVVTKIYDSYHMVTFQIIGRKGKSRAVLSNRNIQIVE